VIQEEQSGGASIQILFRKSFTKFTQPPMQSKFSVAVGSLSYSLSILYLVTVNNIQDHFSILCHILISIGFNSPRLASRSEKFFPLNASWACPEVVYLKYIFRYLISNFCPLSSYILHYTFYIIHRTIINCNFACN
jgi:hypothetical protein